VKTILKRLLLTAVPICLFGMTGCGDQNTLNSSDEASVTPQEEAAIAPILVEESEAAVPEISLSTDVPQEEVAASTQAAAVPDDDIIGVVIPNDPGNPVGKCSTLGNKTECWDTYGNLILDRTVDGCWVVTNLYIAGENYVNFDNRCL
jgi:hypothetical protein